MTTYLLLDTNSLPVKSNFESTFWAAIFHLCTAKSIQTAISEVTLHEAVNLRRDTAVELIEAYGTAHRKLSAVVKMTPAYLPSAEDVSTAYELLLESRFETIALDGEHARLAFEREAKRIPPAHDGAGGRDTAIWLTVVSLLRDGHDVHFVTNNSSDFGKEELIDSMASEIVDLPGSLTYYRSTNSFVDAIATTIDAPAIDIREVSVALAESIRSSVIILLAEDDLDHSQDRVLDSHLELADLTWIRSYLVDETGLGMVKGRFNLADEAGHPSWGTGNFTAWLAFAPDSLTIAPTEVESLDLDVR